MPNIIVETASVSKENKEKLIEALTETSSRITGIPQDFYTVLIKEFPADNWGLGGVPLPEVLKNRCRKS